MTIKKVTVSVADDYMNRFADVVRRCKKVGLEVEQQLKTAGVVTGSIDSAKLADLERVKGVAAVELEREYQLPPPDSDIQ